MTPLAIAVKNRDVEMTTILLQAGADPNRKSLGVPPLHFALTNAFPPSESINYYANLESSHAMIDHLLQNKADINVQADNGQTLLSKAVQLGLFETVIHLIELGADVHIPDAEGKLPIDYAKETKHTLLMRVLHQRSNRPSNLSSV